MTDATTLNAARPGLIARLACEHNHAGCRSEQVQIAPGKGRHNQIDCVPALKELLKSRHAKCIAEVVAERDAELAKAAHQAELQTFGTMMARQKERQADERHAAALKLAKEQVKLTVQQSNAAQKKAAEARTAEELAAEPFVAATRAAEAEAATLEAQAVAAKAALDELQPDRKRQRVEDDAEDAEPTQPPSEWRRRVARKRAAPRRAHAQRWSWSAPSRRRLPRRRCGRSGRTWTRRGERSAGD